ncbi:alpha-glucosidase [Parabacteroides sp. PFB2-12]|uniref:glycoside hydrolase family 97 protein n=1 Tax=unclassified Parabacteroides TaxID=2649774 RepID=UPI0024744E8E|nr:MULTISPECIES: glycoside hydrolase family 97 protein [unclassified Parabacteroides]MDH6342845.1 alpha-glucosidase [Parabacteroides sp. PM6-13]MDH6390525.1 alpha-glucosidase [Parabacteroides sp. PFB2-12]
MNKYTLVFLFFIACLPLYAAGNAYSLRSPNGKLEITLTAGEQLAYTLTRDGQVLVKEGTIGLLLEDRTLGKDARMSKRKTRTVNEEITSPNYRVPSFAVSYNEMDITFRGNYGIRIRAYDEGVAYRFYTTFKQPFIVKDEIADFQFAEDHLSYRAYSTAAQGKDPYAMAFQNLYTKAKLTEADPERVAFLPVTIDYANGTKLTITESDLESYPGMFIRGDGKSASLKGEFAAYPSRMDRYPWRHMTYVGERADYIAKVEGSRDFPWRVLAVSEKDTDMPLNNLVYALAAPNRIGDYSWVKGGKVAWDWWNNWGIYGVDFKAGINMETYKYYIDFASENHIPYVILDEGWYDPKGGNMLTVIPDLNLPELITYANNKKVDIILWTVFNVLDEQLEEACRKYAALGVKGFKVDFLDRDDQTAVEMAYRIAEGAAKHKLTLNFHGFYKPTGLNRTYPNIINFESVFGMEEVKWSTVAKDMMEYDVIMPYIRMMAGPLDYTPGAMRNATKADFKDIYNNPMSQGTRCHQLATYIVHDSPITMLADNPTIYRKEQECTDFITSIPNTGIDETRILGGTLGKYIITARRVGDDWYIGGMTNWDKREVEVDLSFLTGSSYEATLFKDGVNADRQASDYKKELFTATSKDKLKVALAPGGGFALALRKKN